METTVKNFFKEIEKNQKEKLGKPLTNTRARQEYFRLLNCKKWQGYSNEELLAIAEKKYGSIYANNKKN